jgi:hypothetical protein
VVVGAAIPLGLLSGQLGLDLHGVGIMTGVQSIWYAGSASAVSWSGISAKTRP